MVFIEIVTIFYSLFVAIYLLLEAHMRQFKKWNFSSLQMFNICVF